MLTIHAGWELNYRISILVKKCDFEILIEKYEPFQCASDTFYGIFQSFCSDPTGLNLGEKQSYLQASKIVSP